MQNYHRDSEGKCQTKIVIQHQHQNQTASHRAQALTKLVFAYRIRTARYSKRQSAITRLLIFVLPLLVAVRCDCVKVPLDSCILPPAYGEGTLAPSSSHAGGVKTLGTSCRPEASTVRKSENSKSDSRPFQDLCHEPVSHLVWQHPEVLGRDRQKENE